MHPEIRSIHLVYYITLHNTLYGKCEYAPYCNAKGRPYKRALQEQKASIRFSQASPLYETICVCYTPRRMKSDHQQYNCTPCLDLEALLSRAAEEETDIEAVLFENLALESGSYPGLVFRNCRFVGCRLTNCALDRVAFIDCSLEHCDCSNAAMPKSAIERTQLTDCKLVGATLSEAFLLDASFTDCILRYSNFNASKIRHTQFSGCDLSFSALGNCKLAKTTFKRCLLVRAELFQTAFSGVDLSDCDISGIAMSGTELKGARVNLEQAAQLGLLLAGVILADSLPPRA